jgi:hypothetical protein
MQGKKIDRPLRSEPHARNGEGRKRVLGTFGAFCCGCVKTSEGLFDNRPSPRGQNRGCLGPCKGPRRIMSKVDNLCSG